MTTLIVGGDRINAYSEFLSANGFGPILHWSGRRQSECHRTIPRGTQLVVILVDQVNHNLAYKIRRTADEMELPVVYTPRSIGHLGKTLTRFRPHNDRHSSSQ